MKIFEVGSGTSFPLAREWTEDAADFVELLEKNDMAWGVGEGVRDNVRGVRVQLYAT